MKRIFITSIPLQSRAGLKKVIYEPRNFSIGENKETSFPIIPIIRQYMAVPEHCGIITVRTENDDTQTNYGKFVEELAELGIEENQVTNIILKEDQKEVEKKALMRIVDAIPEDSIAYADITFGTKTMSAAVLYAMSVVEYLKDVETGGIFYGEIQRADGEMKGAYLYENTGYKRVMDFLISMDKLGVAERRKALEMIFNV